MSGVEVGGLVNGVFPLLLSTLDAQKDLFKSSRSTIALQSFELDLQVGYQKFKIWQQKWLGQTNQTDASSKALWGAEGWSNVQGMLGRILEISQRIEKVYKALQTLTDAQPRSRWKLAFVRLSKRHEPSFKELKDLAQEFNLAVDAIWLYSETVFDSLHGVLAPGLHAPNRDLLLTSALQSRSGSLKLYKLCCNDSSDCILDLDLKPDTNSKHRLSGTEGLVHLFYQLFTHTPNDPTQLRRLVVENLPESGASHSRPSDAHDYGDSDFQLFKIKSDIEEMIVPVERDGTKPSSCLRIEKPRLEAVQLRSKPESLRTVLKRVRQTSTLSPEEHFSVGAKVELAYKIIESGLFLLGTPWLSLLNSQNILRLKDIDGRRPSFVLEVQTFGLVDLLFDDSEAISEAKQLYHIGILLMEIALDGPSGSQNEKDSSRSNHLLSQLPLVEQIMGAQYCKATAFCLQHRQPKQRFNGLRKYEGSHSKDWEAYLSELLQDYYSQVFLRLEELREIDTVSEYRSRKSWAIEESED